MARSPMVSTAIPPTAPYGLWALAHYRASTEAAANPPCGRRLLLLRLRRLLLQLALR